MSWRSILGKLMTIAKAKINSAVNKLDDPEARLDLAMEEYEEAIGMLKRAMILMAAKKTQIENFKDKTGSNIVRARNMAKKHLTRGTEQGQKLARIHMGTVAYGETTIVEWTMIEVKLGEDLLNLQEDVIFCEESIVALKMRIEMDKMRMTVADATKEAYDHIYGLRNKGTSLAEALGAYEEVMEEKESTVAAVREMVAAGLLTSPMKEALPEPEYGRVDDLMRELEQEIRIAQTSELDPKEMELFATPTRTKIEVTS